MERTLVLSAFALGCLGCLVGMLGTWPAVWRGRPAAPVGAAIPRLTLFLCLLIPVLVCVFSLPERPPFAAGQGFGSGFVIGALGALLAAWMVFRAQDDRATDGFPIGIMASGPLFSAVLTVSIPLLWMHTVLTDALMGVAIGWFVNSFLLLMGALRQEPSDARRPTALTVGIGFMVTLAVTVALGDYRGSVAFASAAAPVSWRAIVAGIGALIALLTFCCTLPTAWVLGMISRLPLFNIVGRVASRLVPDDSTRRSIARAGRILPGALLLLWGANLFAARIGGHPRLLLLAGVGMFIGTIAWWLTRGIGDWNDRRPTAMATEQQNGALTIVLVLSGAMAAYQIMAGVGLGLMLLAAWFIAALALQGVRDPGDAGNESADRSASHASNGGSALTAALMFGSILCLYRLFEVRFARDLHGVTLSDHYALFGFLLGALLPVLLAGYLRRQVAAAPAAPVAVACATFVAGALVLGVPFVMLVLFGAKCALALYFGLAIGAAIALLQPTDAAPTPDGVPVPLASNAGCLLPLLALAAALALAQWTHHVTPMALYSRAEKLRLLGYVASALVALLLAADYGGRYRKWRQAGSGSEERTGRRAQR